MTPFYRVLVSCFQLDFFIIFSAFGAAAYCSLFSGDGRMPTVAAVVATDILFVITDDAQFSARR
jgi:hypothetical protein